MIVDGHVHLISETTGWYSYRKAAKGPDSSRWGVERIVHLMDELKIDKCFLLPLAGLYGFNDYDADNAEIAEGVYRYPDRLIGFCTAFPHQGAQEAADDVRFCVEELGIKGVKFHPWLQAFPANSSDLHPCLKICSRYRLPVVFHTGTPPYSQPFQVMDQARRFPDVPFIMGHFGKLLFLDALRAAERYPNIYLETSSVQFSHLAMALERVPAERIIFGTDAPIGGTADAKWNLLKIKCAPVGEAQRRAILGENAMRLIEQVRV